MSRLVRLLAFPCLMAGVVTLWIQWQPLASPDTAVTAEIEIVARKSCEAWLRFDRGEGWNFGDTRAFWITESAEPRTYRIPLPAGKYRQFGVLTFEPAGSYLVTGGRVVEPDAGVVADLESKPPHEGTPAAFLVSAQPFEVQGASGTSTWEALIEFCLLAGTFLLLSFLIARRSASLAPRMAAAWQKAGASSRAHPTFALLGCAMLAVAASCHPVIFFGRSFVSPNNGALCLYDTHPTLPGAVAAVEQWSGSDVYATLWAHLPYTRITADAVLRDGEIPLWNRYDMCGVTLLGQGQSMPGDPLAWIAILSRGAAWAWDLRFLLSKALFCFGIALLAWTATRRLPVAALVAFSAAFIGFFSFRFNHPAFFSVCYAPWILLCWLRAAEAPSLRRTIVWGFALIAADWLELNSGTAKEAAILLLGMNAAGGLVLALRPRPWRDKARRLAIMAAAGVAFLALSAPLWLVFLDTLSRSVTPYDAPETHQLAPSVALGLFDDLFYRELMINEWHVAPALNFLVLLGVLWLLADLTRLRREPVALALALTALPFLAVVFGILPPWLLDRVPFVRNISHVDNVFTCALLPLALVLAAFGLRNCLEKVGDPAAWWRDWWRTLAMLGALAALYFGSVHAVPRAEFASHLARPFAPGRFFIGCTLALFGAVALLPWLLRRLVLRGFSPVAILALVLCLAAVHFRQGMWLETKFNSYVMNPQPRAVLDAPSKAVELLRSLQAEPARVAGFGKILRPGFNALLGLESPFGSDAVVNRRFGEWLDAAGIGRLAAWAPDLTRRNLAAHQRAYDALNVRYYLASAASAGQPAPGLKRIASCDLEVFESESAWPRAFFTGSLLRYRDLSALGDLLRDADTRPFAAMQEGAAGVTLLPPASPARPPVPARDYRLTSNTTRFAIDAAAPGIAVLSEAFPVEDAWVRVNGKPAKVLGVNHAFVGVFLPAAGTYDVTFGYRPRMLTTALWLAAAAAGALVIIAIVTGLGARAALPAVAHGSQQL